MQRSILWPVLMVLVLGGGALFWTLSERGEGRRSIKLSSPASQEPRAAQEDPQVAASPLLSSSPLAEGVPVLERQVPDAQRESLASGASLGPGKSVQIRVLDGVGGEPLAGVKVYARFLSADPSSPEAESSSAVAGTMRMGDLRRLDGGSLDAMVAGQVARLSDAAGLVRVPAPLGGLTLVVARHGGHWGRLVLEQQEQLNEELIQELVLETDQRLVVQALDPNGKPVGGVPIQIQSFQWNSWHSQKELVSSEEKGEVSFEHVQLLIREQENVATWRVAAAILVELSPHVTLEPNRLPSETVELEIPLGNTVEVSVLDPEGLPEEQSGKVKLRLVLDGQSRRQSVFSHDQRQTVERELKNGKARFEHVAPGIELEASYQRESSGVPTHVYTPGPRQGSGLFGILLTLGEDHPVLRMRLLDASGEPMRKQTVSLTLVNRAAGLMDRSAMSSVTDAKGLIIAELNPGWTGGSLVISESASSSCSITLDRTFPTGITELGDLSFGATPLIVSGIVLGVSGEPLGEAKLELKRVSGEDNWEHLWSHDQNTEADGTFELRGRLETGQYRLEVEVAQYIGQPLEFELGSSNHVFQLRPAGRLMGRVLLDDSIQAQELSIRLDSTSTPPAALGWRLKNSALKADGTFLCGPLPAGEYSVSVTMGWRKVLHMVEGIAVEGGFDTRDPKLAAIDLRGQLHAFRITLEVEGKEPLGRVTLNYGEAGSDSMDQTEWLYNGNEILLMASSPSIDVDIHAAGHRLRSLRGITGDQVVQLKRGLLVRVVLVGDGEPFKAPYGLSLGFTLVDGTGSDLDWGAPRFDSSREILLRVASAGQLNLTWILEVTSGGSASARPELSDPLQVITLLDSDGEQRVEVRLSSEESARLLKKLKE